MSTVSMSKQRSDAAVAEGPLVSPIGWLQIGVLGLLFVAVFRDMLRRIYGWEFSGLNLEMHGYAWTNADWSHALVVPLISLYFLYQHRHNLRAARLDPSRLDPATENIALAFIAGMLPVAVVAWLVLGSSTPIMVRGATSAAIGLAGMALFVPVRKPLRALLGAHIGEILLILGIVGYILGIHPIRNDMVKGYSMILALGGLVWFVCGAKVARIAWFPVFYLVFAIKISQLIWNRIAFELQGIASKVGGVMINLLGMPIKLEAEVTGHTINLWHDYKPLPGGLDIEQACSGLRMLMTFIALGFAVAYLADRPWWARLTIVLLTVPIAIIVNVGRVTTLGMIYPFNPDMARGEFHIFIGLVMLGPALGLFMLVGWILSKLVVHEPQPAAGSGDNAS
jgi:exosortase